MCVSIQEHGQDPSCFLPFRGRLSKSGGRGQNVKGTLTSPPNSGEMRSAGAWV